MVATVAPTAPIKFPRRAVFGAESPLSAIMNEIATTSPIRA